MPEEIKSDEMTFFEHLDALRPHLFRSAAALFVIMVAAFLCKDFVIDTLLLGPQSPWFPTNRFFAWLAGATATPALAVNSVPLNMVNTVMAGQFNLHLKVSLWTAVVVTVPYMLWEIWSFVKPALTPAERRGTNKVVFYVSLCFFSGAAFGYMVICPLTVNFLGNYEASGMITNMIDVNSYLSTVMNVTLATGVVFLLPLAAWVLARMGIITPAFMKRYRRHAIVVLAILAAVITPPDLFSMTLVLVPMYLLYEVSIGIAARVYREREKER